MALDTEHYAGVEVGEAGGGFRLVAVRDPCDPDSEHWPAAAIGATDAGLRLVAKGLCDTSAVEAGAHYFGVVLGKTPAGLPLVAVPCVECGPPPPNCQLRVRGCGGIGLPGAEVEIYSGATLIASGTTDASGILAYYLPATGVYQVVVARDRFATYDANRTLVCTSGGTLIEMEPASGYVCLPCCNPIPVKETLHATTSEGLVVLTYSAILGYWTGSLGVSRTCATSYRVEDCVPPTHTCVAVSQGTGGGTVTWDFLFEGTNCSLGFQGKAAWASEVLGCNPPPGTDPCTRSVWLQDGASCVGADPTCSCPFPGSGGWGGVGTVVSCEPLQIEVTLDQVLNTPCETVTATITEAP